MNIRDADAKDADAICGIYNPHVRSTIVTFEEVDVTAPEMAARIAGIRAAYPWLVAEQDKAVVGYAYAAKFNDRSAYRFTTVSTVYVHENAQGAGLGTMLYRDLFKRLSERSIRSAVGLISLPNAASVALHEKCGFKKVAHLEKVGFKFGQWIDVGYWQVLL